MRTIVLNLCMATTVALLLPGCPFELIDPTSDAGAVVLTDDGDVVAFSVDGSTIVWSDSVGSGSAGDVLVDGGYVFVAYEGSNVVAFDGADGTELWSADIGGTSRGRLALSGDSLFVQTTDDVIALDADTGSILWSWSYAGLSGGMATGEGSLYCAGDPVRRLEPGSGEEASDAYEAGQTVSDIVVSGGRVVLGGRYDVVSLTMGLGEDWVYPLDNASASGLAEDLGDVYVSTDNDGLLGFESADPSPFMTALGGMALDAPVVADGMVYVTESYGDLYCLDAASGAEDWSWSTSQDLSGGVRVLGSTVYLADGNALVGLDADTGSAEWEQSPGGTILDVELL
jgi:eukaryotic-like serine/threonine-protein kinase